MILGFPSYRRGFAFVEVLTVVAVVALLSAFALPALRIFNQQKSLDASSQGILETLRVSQSKTLASEEATSYGVYFDTQANPQNYVLFKGASFATRDTAKDRVYTLPATIEFSNVGVVSSQVVFEKITGNANQSGSVSVWLKADHSNIRSTFIDVAGNVTTSQQSVPSDESRAKDSRHTHINYAGREIQTSENIVLTFPNNGSPVIQQILISSNMQSGQVFWEGTIAVGGENQTLIVATHAFNDQVLGTQFSLHRDKRYNTKDITIALDGDATGTIIQYTAQGQTSKGTSLYVSDPIWQ